MAVIDAVAKAASEGAAAFSKRCAVRPARVPRRKQRETRAVIAKERFLVARAEDDPIGKLVVGSSLPRVIRIADRNTGVVRERDKACHWADIFRLGIGPCESPVEAPVMGLRNAK